MKVNIKVAGEVASGKTQLLLALRNFIADRYRIDFSSGEQSREYSTNEYVEGWDAIITPKEDAILTNTPRPGDAPGSRDRHPTTTGEAIDALLTERGKTHGDYTRHAEITQEIKDVMHRTIGAKHTIVHRESLEMIAHKIGRILAGDPDFRDHWDDIAGYAKLAADRCSK